MRSVDLGVGCRARALAVALGDPRSRYLGVL